MGRRSAMGLLLRLTMLVLLGAVLAAVLRRDDIRDWMVDDSRFAAEIRLAALQNGLDPALVRAVVFQESRFDPFARGGQGEVGLMQVLPRGAVADWAAAMRRPEPSVTALCEPTLNLEIGCWFLGRAMRRWSDYRDGVELALAQYNAGGSRAERWKPPTRDGEVISRITIESTRRYVSRIMTRYRKYCVEDRGI